MAQITIPFTVSVDVVSGVDGTGSAGTVALWSDEDTLIAASQITVTGDVVAFDTTMSVDEDTGIVALGVDGVELTVGDHDGAGTETLIVSNEEGHEFTFKRAAALTTEDGGTVDETYGSAEADVINNAVARIAEIEAVLIGLGFLTEPS
jgi:hypothetical protein